MTKDVHFESVRVLDFPLIFSFSYVKLYVMSLRRREIIDDDKNTDL